MIRLCFLFCTFLTFSFSFSHFLITMWMEWHILYFFPKMCYFEIQIFQRRSLSFLLISAKTYNSTYYSFLQMRQRKKLFQLKELMNIYSNVRGKNRWNQFFCSNNIRTYFSLFSDWWYVEILSAVNSIIKNGLWTNLFAPGFL